MSKSVRVIKTATFRNGGAKSKAISTLFGDQINKMIDKAPDHLLDEEFNAKLAEMRNGCKKAERFLVHSNYLLVAQRVAAGLKFVTDKTVTPDDRFQFGCIGLLKALKEFDPELGYRFSTYAVWWIDQQLGRGVVDTTSLRTFRLPVHVQSQISRIVKFERENNVNVNSEDAVKKLNAWIAANYETPVTYTFEEVMRLKQAGGALNVTDQLLVGSEGEGEATTIYDVRPSYDLNYHSPEKTKQQQADADKMMIAAGLTKREQMVMTLRFARELTLEEVGAQYGVTRERIRQVQNIALKKLETYRNKPVEKIVVVDDKVVSNRPMLERLLEDINNTPKKKFQNLDICIRRKYIEEILDYQDETGIKTSKLGKLTGITPQTISNWRRASNR